MIAFLTVTLCLASFYCLAMWCRDEWRRFQDWSQNVYPTLERERRKRIAPLP